MDCALYDKAQIDYAYYTSTIPLAGKELAYLGHMAFFLEQAVEKMLRQVLLDCKVSASFLTQVPELARMAQKSVPQMNPDIIKALTGEIGTQLVAWDMSGRYTQMYIPDLDVVEYVESIYSELVKLHKHLLASEPTSVDESYTDHFKQFVSERT